MQIRLKDDRVFSGTARQIVSAMKSTALGQADISLAEYVAFVCSNTERFEGQTLEVVGDDDDARAKSLIGELVRVGLAVRL